MFSGAGDSKGRPKGSWRLCLVSLSKPRSGLRSAHLPRNVGSIWLPDLARLSVSVRPSLGPLAKGLIGKSPSAKITTLREAAQYLLALPVDTAKVIVMNRSLRSSHLESLAEYFCRLNSHLLGPIHVLEIDDDGRKGGFVEVSQRPRHFITKLAVRSGWMPPTWSGDYRS